MSGQPNTSQYRTTLSRAIGLGASKSGSHHWWMQRLTSVALIPLGLWFCYKLFSLYGASYEETYDSLGSPLSTVYLIALVIVATYHAIQGLQVIYEDYISCHAVRLVFYFTTLGGLSLVAIACIMAILKLFIVENIIEELVL